MPDSIRSVHRVHAISRFINNLVLNYEVLRSYRKDPTGYFPERPADDDTSAAAEIARKALERAATVWGIDDDDDLALLRDGDFEAIFEDLALHGPKPTSSGDAFDSP